MVSICMVSICLTVHVAQLTRWQRLKPSCFGRIYIKDRNIAGKCKLRSGVKCLSAVKSSTSNLRKHLQAKHSSKTLEERGRTMLAPQLLTRRRRAFSSAYAVTLMKNNELIAGRFGGDATNISSQLDEMKRIHLKGICTVGYTPLGQYTQNVQGVASGC